VAMYSTRRLACAPVRATAASEPRPCGPHTPKPCASSSSSSASWRSHSAISAGMSGTSPSMLKKACLIHGGEKHGLARADERRHDARVGRVSGVEIKRAFEADEVRQLAFEC